MKDENCRGCKRQAERHQAALAGERIAPYRNLTGTDAAWQGERSPRNQVRAGLEPVAHTCRPTWKERRGGDNPLRNNTRTDHGSAIADQIQDEDAYGYTGNLTALTVTIEEWKRELERRFSDMETV